MPVADCRKPVADCRSRIVGCELRTGEASLAEAPKARRRIAVSFPRVSRCRASVPIALLLVVCTLNVGAQPLASAKPAASLDAARLADIRPVVEEAIAAHKLPGAVIVAGRGDRVDYRQAFGNRALVPSVEPMTLDTIFDLASLTKVVATTTAVMQLVENGRIPPCRQGLGLRARIRALRQGSHHDPAPVDAHVRPPARSRARRSRSRARARRFAAPSRKCRSRSRANASSIPTSTSSCSANRRAVSAASGSTPTRRGTSSRRSA